MQQYIILLFIEYSIERFIKEAVIMWPITTQIKFNLDKYRKFKTINKYDLISEDFGCQFLFYL